MNAKGTGAEHVLLLLQQSLIRIPDSATQLFETPSKRKQPVENMQQGMQDTHGQINVSDKASTNERACTQIYCIITFVNLCNKCMCT